MKDILSEIIANKKIEVSLQKEQLPLAKLEEQLQNKTINAYSLKDALLNSKSGIIAEFKRKSPSKG